MPGDHSAMSHQIATEAANLIMRRGIDAGLPWGDISISLETAVVIVTVACATMSKTPQPAQFIREIIDVVTERAHSRAMEYFLEDRPDAG